MEKKGAHFGGHAGIYSRFRPTYPASLYRYLAEQTAGHRLAWDCAAGSGQASRDLNDYYDYVVATDHSYRQLAEAAPLSTLGRVVATAEAVPLADGCADLVTVAQAFHWFDPDRFLDEVQRVLGAGGVIAIWNYGLFRIDPELDRVIDHFYAVQLGPYWPPERLLIEQNYPHLHLPWPELAPPPFEIEVDWDLEQLTGYLASWSAYQRYLRANDDDPLQQIAKQLADAWGNTTVRRIRWPLNLRLARRD